MSRLRRYTSDSSQVIQVDGIHVRENLTVDTSPMQIENQKVKQLLGKEISLVKVVCGGLAGGNVTWELEESDEGFVSESIHLT